MLGAIREVDTAITSMEVNAENINETQLESAVRDVATRIIGENVTPNSAGSVEDENSELCRAVLLGHTQFIKIQIEENVNKVKRQGSTLMCLASLKGYLEIVYLLIQAEVEVDKITKEGSFPLYFASDSGHIEIVKLLIAAKANVDKADKDGITSICIASYRGYFQIAQMLIEAKADVNKAAKSGVTPIFAASQEGHFLIVEMLIKAGADVNIADDEGSTPLLLASQNGHFLVVQMLLEAKADINKCNEGGGSPLTQAREAGHTEIVDWLLAEIEQRKSQKSTDSLPVNLPLPQAPVVRLRKSYGTSLIANLTDSFERTKSSKKTADMTEKHEKVKSVFDGVLGEKKNKAIM